MRRLDALRLSLALALGATCAVLLVRIARHAEEGGRLVAEIGRERVTSIDPRTRAVLAGLEGRLFLTYYVSGAEHMPSHLRGVERRVTDLFRALQAAAPGKVSWQIVDPANDPDLAGFSARRRIAPFRARSITRDAYDERTVWSSIVVSYGAHEAIVDGVVPERVPLLQRLIVEHVQRMETPRRPVLALDAPDPALGLGGFEELADRLAERGELVRVDLSAGDPFPADADVLFWMRPVEASPRRLAEVERFLERGRSVVVAGSALVPDGPGLAQVDGRPALLLRPAPDGLSNLLARFDLTQAVELVGDERAGELVLGEERVPAPFRVRCIAPNQDFRGWRGQPNGNLFFDFPTPLFFDADALRDKGYEARVRATTSDMTWVQEAPLRSPLPLERVSPAAGQPVAKQALLCELAPDDPWRGRLVALAASTPLEDGWLFAEGAAHRRLLDVLLGELASPDRLALNAAGFRPAAPLPELSFAARLLARGFCVLLVPLLLLSSFLRGRLARPRAPRARRRRGVLPLSLGAAAAALLLGLRLLRPLDLGVDLTADARNRLAPETRALCTGLLAEHPATCELVLSARDRLPPELRPTAEEVRDLLARLGRAGARLETRVLDPDGRDAGRRDALRADGIEPVRLVVRAEESTSVRRVFAALRLSAGERVEVVSLADPRALEELEFRVVFALWRLATGRHPHVAFASDAPRLSAAEAYEDYQQKGLFAPKGSDVYSTAREIVRAAGYRVTHVNPREPELPEAIDALVWLQPRRSIEAMLEATVRYLVGGGNVLLAAQHFNIQARQYRGAEFEVVHWPQPQSPDVERLYFPDIGVELVREVLFDARDFTTTIESQVSGRGASREWHRHETALPFLVRASSANMDPTSPVTRDLGDQAFFWPAWLRLDAERLAAHGLSARPLIETSGRTWSLDWKGGWIPPELLLGPPRGEDGRELTLGRLPLAALIEGTFPRPEAPLRLNPGAPAPADVGGAAGVGGAEATPGPAEEEAPWPDPAPGRLLFLGASEELKDAHVLDETFRADHLLLNAVAFLALPPELAAVATRRREPRGFDWVPARERLRWRAVVIGAGPAALLALGLVRSLVRRRPPRRPAGARSA